MASNSLKIVLYTRGVWRTQVPQRNPGAEPRKGVWERSPPEAEGLLMNKHAIFNASLMKILIKRICYKNPTAHLQSFQNFILRILKFLLHILCPKTRYFRPWSGPPGQLRPNWYFTRAQTRQTVRRLTSSQDRSRDLRRCTTRTDVVRHTSQRERRIHRQITHNETVTELERTGSTGHRPSPDSVEFSTLPACACVSKPNERSQVSQT